jgi:hypothetical protein
LERGVELHAIQPTYADGYANPYRDPHTYTDPSGDTDSYTHTDTHAYADPNFYSYADADTCSYTNADAYRTVHRTTNQHVGQERPG